VAVSILHVGHLASRFEFLFIIPDFTSLCFFTWAVVIRENFTNTVQFVFIFLFFIIGDYSQRQWVLPMTSPCSLLIQQVPFELELIGCNKCITSYIKLVSTLAFMCELLFRRIIYLLLVWTPRCTKISLYFKFL
jgi:hypothetical protein